MAVNFVNQPPWRGTDLVAVYNDLLVDVWQSGSVNGTLSAHGARRGQADRNRPLAHHRRRRITQTTGYRRPVLLADRNGTVSMWETFSTRLSDHCRPTRLTARSPGPPCCRERAMTSP